MKKVNITLAFDEDKLGALEFSLKKENASVQSRMEDALRQLYEESRAGAGAGISGQQGCARCQAQAPAQNCEAAGSSRRGEICTACGCVGW